MPYGRKGNRRSGVALAMRQRPAVYQTDLCQLLSAPLWHVTSVAVRRVANCYTPFTFITLLYLIYHLVSHLIVWFIHLGGAYRFTAYRRKTGSWAPRLHYSRYIYLHDQVLQVREQQTQILIISIPRNLGYIFGGTRISLQHSLG